LGVLAAFMYFDYLVGLVQSKYPGQRNEWSYQRQHSQIFMKGCQIVGRVFQDVEELCEAGRQTWS